MVVGVKQQVYCGDNKEAKPGAKTEAHYVPDLETTLNEKLGAKLEINLDVILHAKVEAKLMANKEEKLDAK